MEPKRRKLRDNRAGGGDAVLPPGPALGFSARTGARSGRGAAVRRPAPRKRRKAAGLSRRLQRGPYAERGGLRLVSGACRRQQPGPTPAGAPHPALYHSRSPGAYFIRPAPCRRHPVVEGDGIPSDDPPGCPPGSGGYGLADGGMAAAAPVQISVDSRWDSVPDVLVRLLHLSACPSGNAAVSGRNPGPSGG